MRATTWTVGALGLLIAGCSGYGNSKGTSADGSSADSAARTSAPVLRGTVAYRERMALPPDAEAYLWIIDTTPGIITTQVVIGEATVKADGQQIPLPFELAYDASRIAADHDYGVKAVIRSGGKAMFETKEATAVITKGNPTEVDLMLVRAED